MNFSLILLKNLTLCAILCTKKIAFYISDCRIQCQGVMRMTHNRARKIPLRQLINSGGGNVSHAIQPVAAFHVALKRNVCGYYEGRKL